MPSPLAHTLHIISIIYDSYSWGTHISSLFGKHILLISYLDTLFSWPIFDTDSFLNSCFWNPLFSCLIFDTLFLWPILIYSFSSLTFGPHFPVTYQWPTHISPLPGFGTQRALVEHVLLVTVLMSRWPWLLGLLPQCFTRTMTQGPHILHPVMLAQGSLHQCHLQSNISLNQ